MKIILSIFLITSILFSNNIKFKETRYLAALDFERDKHGSLYVDNDILTIQYTRPSKENIIYYSDKIVIQKDDNQTNEYSFEKYPQAQYMGLILKAIVSSNYDTISDLFEVKIQENGVILNSKPVSSDVIETITVVKDKNILKSIIIDMTNKDKITIETIN